MEIQNSLAYLEDQSKEKLRIKRLGSIYLTLVTQFNVLFNFFTVCSVDVDEIWLQTETDDGFKCTIVTICGHRKSSTTKFKDTALF